MRRLLALVLGVVLVGGAAAFALLYGATDTKAEATSPSATTAAPAAAGAPAAGEAAASFDPAFPHAFTERSFGKADAPLTLIEYQALTCNHCAHFHLQILPLIKQDYIDKGLVRIVIREFPFNEIGLKAAMVSRCLPESSFYDVMQALFSVQAQWSNPSVGDTMLRQIAGFAGMSPAMYDACVKNTDLSDMLLKLRVEATNQMQITSTPTLLVEGTLERVVGTQSYEEYIKVIDRQLVKKGITPPKHEAAPAAATESHAH